MHLLWRERRYATTGRGQCQGLMSEKGRGWGGGGVDLGGEADLLWREVPQPKTGRSG